MPRPLPQHVQQITFVIWHATRHFLFQCFHRKYFDPYINDVRNIKAQVFDKQVMRYKRVLAKLNFDGYTLLHKVSLVIRHDRIMPCVLYRQLLRFRRESIYDP